MFCLPKFIRAVAGENLTGSHFSLNNKTTSETWWLHWPGEFGGSWANSLGSDPALPLSRWVCGSATWAGFFTSGLRVTWICVCGAHRTVRGFLHLCVTILVGLGILGSELGPDEWKLQDLPSASLVAQGSGSGKHPGEDRCWPLDRFNSLFWVVLWVRIVS